MRDSSESSESFLQDFALHVSFLKLGFHQRGINLFYSGCEQIIELASSGSQFC